MRKLRFLHSLGFALTFVLWSSVSCRLGVVNIFKLYGAAKWVDLTM